MFVENKTDLQEINSRRSTDYPQYTPRHNDIIIPQEKRLRKITNATTAATNEMQSSANTKGTEAKVKVGNVIRHERFGIGTVSAVEGTGDNTKATVAFDNVGNKQLLLKFAKFEILQ